MPYDYCSPISFAREKIKCHKEPGKTLLLFYEAQTKHNIVKLICAENKSALVENVLSGN